ncbi:MAG: hypothetical protein AVDCRST_MAG13-4019, partial [uncultured Solirubrobacteraceae bacterium]
GRRREGPHRDRHPCVPRGGPGAQAAEDGGGHRPHRPRRHPAVPPRAAGRPRDEGHRLGRARPRRDAPRVLQHHGRARREGRGLARGVHLRAGEGDGGRAVPAPHRHRGGEAGGALPLPAGALL